MEIEIVPMKKKLVCNTEEYNSMAEMLEEIKNTNPADKSSWGPKAWRALHAICDYIPCGVCSEHCHEMIDFEHDYVNAFKGKELYQPDKTKEYLKGLNSMIGKKMR
ncbi:MAG: hypothetical protein QXL94_03040 [Candidatus Parvarchaeum sp.]